MPTLVELEQLLDIALTTPEVGTVNFNILRVLLQEILRHLNIENKLIDVESLQGELKSAYDFIKDGYVEIQNRDVRSGRTSDTAERRRTTITTTPEETVIRDEKDDDERSKSETPALVVEESELQAPEGSPVSQDSPTVTLKPSSGLSESRDSPAASLKQGSGLSVKEQPPLSSRSSVMLIRRSDSFRNLKKMLSELQERVEVLESQAAPTADPVRSAVSLVRKESRTPAHDFVELINIKRKLEASENSLEGLSDMVDALTADVNELKEILPGVNSQVPSEVISEIEELKNSFKAFKVGEESKQLNTLAEIEKRMNELEGILANLKDTMDEIKNKQGTYETMKLSDEGQASREISEALQQRLEAYEKQLDGLTAQIQEVQEKVEGRDAKSFGAEQAASDAFVKIEALGMGVNDFNAKIAGFDKEMKNQKSLIEDNEMQIHQLKNTITLLQRESLDRANVEAAKTKEEKVVEPVETPAPRRRSTSTDRDELSLIRTMIFDLQEEKEKMKQMHLRLSDELYKKQKYLDDLYNLVDELRDVKADKELLSTGFELEARMESMRPKPVEKPPPEEFAAGFRRQFLVNHNCISCDRPVKYAREGTFPPLPTMHPMPGSKSNRPYTTFELEQIRQHMLQGGLVMSKERFALLEKQRNKLQKEILRLSGVRDIHELAEVTARACGGIHTQTYPHSQAIVRGLQLNRDEFDFLVPQKDFQPVDILGQDGHIYKGLLESLPPTLPQIPQKSKSPGMSNLQRNLRRSTTPASANAQKIADEVDSA